VLDHILFTNGNGYQVDESGNLQQMVSFRRTVDFRLYYKQQLTFDEMVRQDEDYRDHEVDKLFESKKELNSFWESLDSPERVQTEEELWKEAYDEDLQRYDEVDKIDNYSAEDLYDVDKLVAMAKDTKWAAHLSISSGYYILDKLTDKTDEYLLLVGLAMCNAYIKILTEVVESGEIGGQNPYSLRATPEDNLSLIASHRKVIPQLEKQVVRLTAFVGDLMAQKDRQIEFWRSNAREQMKRNHKLQEKLDSFGELL